MHAALFYIVFAAAPVLAHDLGESVRFQSKRSLSFAARGEGVLLDTGASDPLAEPWDTVLLHGELPEPELTLEFARVRPGLAPEWRPLEVHASEDGRFWAKGRAEKAAGALRLRVRGKGRGRDVVIYQVEAFADEPGPAEAAARRPAAPPPPAPRPPLHTREEWKAAAPRASEPDPAPWRITVHHTEGRYTTTLEASLQEAKNIQSFHMNGRKWSDIAYHFLVDAAGHILEGRKEGTLGSHTYANNAGNIGIVFLGSYHPERNDVITPEQLEAAVAIARYAAKRYKIKPDALKGHRDYRSTDCPGDGLYARLPALRGSLAVELSEQEVAAIERRITRFSLPDFDGKTILR